MIIIWKDIPGYPGYRATSGGHIMGKRGRMMKGWVNPLTGYRHLQYGKRKRKVKNQ